MLRGLRHGIEMRESGLLEAFPLPSSGKAV
jgi:hypothetical protein